MVTLENRKFLEREALDSRKFVFFFLLSNFAPLSNLLLTQKQDPKVSFPLELRLLYQCISNRHTWPFFLTGSGDLWQGETKERKPTEMPALQGGRIISPALQRLLCSCCARPRNQSPGEIPQPPASTGSWKSQRGPLWNIKSSLPSLANSVIGAQGTKRSDISDLGSQKPIQGMFSPQFVQEALKSTPAF